VSYLTNSRQFFELNDGVRTDLGVNSRDARTFSWFGRNRWPLKDFENLVETLTSFVTLASAACQFWAVNSTGHRLHCTMMEVCKR
jgi:hypothetical protein